MSKYLTKNVRVWIYGVSIAALPVLTHYGVIDAQAQALAIPLLLALLNIKDDEVAE